MQCACSHRKGMRTHLYGRVRVNSKPKSQADYEYEGDVNLTGQFKKRFGLGADMGADRPLMRHDIPSARLSGPKLEVVARACESRGCQERRMSTLGRAHAGPPVTTPCCMQW